jgi:hypothetical protein
LVKRMGTRIAVGWLFLVAALGPAFSAQSPARAPASQEGSRVREGINEKGLNRRAGRRKGTLSPATLRSRPLDLIIRGAVTPPVADPSQPKRVVVPSERPEPYPDVDVRPAPLSFRILTEPPEPEEEEEPWGKKDKGKGKGKEKTVREQARRPEFLARTPASDRQLNPYLRPDVRAFYGIEPRGSFYQKSAPEITVAPSARTPRAATGSYSDWDSSRPRGRKAR